MDKNRYSAYIFIAPIFAFFSFFILYPLFDTVRLSFFEWNGFSDAVYTGLDNYKKMFSDPVFYTAVKNYLIFAVLVVSIQMLTGFGLAYLMRRNTRLFKVYKTVIFTPIVLTSVVVYYTFSRILAFDDGAINTFLRGVGLGALASQWTGDPNLAIFTMIGVTIWSGTGFSMAVYSSALTALPADYLEAAHIDGANKFQAVTRIVWPMLRDTHYSLTFIGAISALKIFDIVFLLTGGGPFHSSEVLSTYMYFKVFKENEDGFGAAVSTIMILIALSITVFQLRLSRKEE